MAEKIKYHCSCLTWINVEIKESKRGFRYIFCPTCGVITGLPDIKKPTGWTGHNTTELIEDLKGGI